MSPLSPHGQIETLTVICWAVQSHWFQVLHEAYLTQWSSPPPLIPALTLRPGPTYPSVLDSRWHHVHIFQLLWRVKALNTLKQMFNISSSLRTSEDSEPHLLVHQQPEWRHRTQHCQVDVIEIKHIDFIETFLSSCVHFEGNWLSESQQQLCCLFQLWVLSVGGHIFTCCPPESRPKRNLNIFYTLDGLLRIRISFIVQVCAH